MVLEPLRARRAARLSSSVRRRRRRRGRFRTSNYRDRPRAVANVAQKVCRSSEIGKLRLLSPGALRRCKTYPGPSSIFKVLLLLQGGALVELLGTQGASRSGWDVFPRTQCPVVMRNDTVSWGYRYIRCAIGVDAYSHPRVGRFLSLVSTCDRVDRRWCNCLLSDGMQCCHRCYRWLSIPRARWRKPAPPGTRFSGKSSLHGRISPGRCSRDVGYETQ